MRLNSIRRWMLCGVGSLALAACGGGGSGGGPIVSVPAPTVPPTPTPAPSPTPTPTPSASPTPSGIAGIAPQAAVATRSANDDVEYRRNYSGFEYVHALYALDHGWTGQGVLVGVADDGVLANAELAGQVSPLSRDFGTVTTAGKTTDRNVVGDAYSDHGTLVAGVIAGRDDGMGIQGIAPGAKIVGLRVSDVNTGTGEETLGRQLPTALDYAAANGVKVVNISLGKVDSAQQSPVWQAMVAKYAAAGGLVVNAGGNESEANATGYLDLTAANRDGWLFVIALDETGTGPELATYSNRCGATAMARCVAAMGTQAMMDANGQLVLFGGTSAATAQVSGVAALILGKWPQLTGVQAGQVILATARDIGAPGVDATYGTGLVDVQAALSPVAPTLSNGTAQTALAGSTMVIPEAVGGVATSTTIKAMLANVTLLDGYGRDYSGSLAGLVADPQVRRGSFARQFAAGVGADTLRFQTPEFAANFGYASYRNGLDDANSQTRMTFGEVSARLGTMRVLAAYRGQDAVQDEAMGLAPVSDVALAYAARATFSMGFERSLGAGRLSLSMLTGEDASTSSRGVLLGWNGPALRIKAGMVAENGSVFGTPVGTGALRFGDGARTVFVEMSRNWRVGAWSLHSYASVGATRIAIGPDTLLTSASPILTQRLGLSASHAAWGGRLRFGLALPLVAFAGSGTLTYATAYDLATRSLVYRRQRVDLDGGYAPVMTLGYERTGRTSSLRLAATANTTADEARMLASWRVTLP